MKYRVGIVGATGAVGAELIECLQQRHFPFSELVLMASSRSVGKKIKQASINQAIQSAEAKNFKGLDFVFFTAGASVSKSLIPEALQSGCTVIDNTAAFRMAPEVPLVIPEVNAEALRGGKTLIANPNCSTTIALMALAPLHHCFTLKGFFAASYQAVSGAGAGALKEFEQQSKARTPPESSEYFPHSLTQNILPHVGAALQDGQTDEELKMALESRKILELPQLKVGASCVRVPIPRAHSIAIHAEFKTNPNLEKAREALERFPGIQLDDNLAENRYPMPRNYAGKANCGVGRLRADGFFEKGLAFWVVGDQLLKGAALNAVQIAETLVHP